MLGYLVDIQLFYDNDEFVLFSVIKNKFHLSIATYWQYLQLHIFLKTQFGPVTSSPLVIPNHLK